MRPTPRLKRRDFFRLTARASAAACAILSASTVRAASSSRLGQGEFQYEPIPGWGVLDEKTPVNNCHGLARDRQGHIFLLTDDPTNNVIVFDKRGKLVHKWGTVFPGAHGLSLVAEGAREVLYITDLKPNRVAKTTLDGSPLAEWLWPSDSGKYEKADRYRPSWTLHRANGAFFVLDGYGRDYILRYGADGQSEGFFGGAEGGIVHWGPHGGTIDRTPAGEETLLIAMSDKRYLLRLDLNGHKLSQVDLPGGNPRQIGKSARIISWRTSRTTGPQTAPAAVSSRSSIRRSRCLRTSAEPLRLTMKRTRCCPWPTPARSFSTRTIFSSMKTKASTWHNFRPERPIR